MKMWIAREPSGLLVLSEHKMIWCTDHWYAPADDILDLHDKNQYPEVTFENSPMEVELKYKEGDRVRIKSLDWYNKSERNGNVYLIGWFNFIKPMADFCGKIVTIKEVQSPYNYRIFEDGGIHYYTDEMIEGLVEEETKNNNDMEEKETLLGWVKESDTLRLVPHKDYEIKHDGDNFYLVKKKKEYPKTYKECCEIVKVGKEHTLEGTTIRINYKIALLESFQKLLICRDAYWKIAGEEMGLGKPWEPDWTDSLQTHYCITNKNGYIQKIVMMSFIQGLAFPTAEIRDAFYENFKEEIESCKEFL